MTTEVTIRWLSFQDHRDEILQLRRQVYVEEQCFPESVISAPQDRNGLHLGAFREGRLVACISAYVHENAAPLLIEHRLPATVPRAVQFTKRVSLPEIRGTHLNEVLTAMLIRAVHETLCPPLMFLTLKGPHRALQSFYGSAYGFDLHTNIEASDGVETIMTITDEARLRASYLKVRNLTELAFMQHGLRAPSLVSFLERVGRLELFALEKLKQDNLYVAPLSMKDEQPRLSAQTRVMYREQKSRLSATPFPPAPARLLDLGAGPGVYLSMLSRESKLRGYELVGLDAMTEMVAYARINRPDIRWIRASAYDTGEPTASYDVVHVNFVFIHLMNPAAVLREVNRILKPGGIFYIFETNDSTFEGPPAIAELIQSHCDLYLGNRRLMNTLPDIAAEHGFETVQRYSTRLRNTGIDHDPVIVGDEMRLNRMTMWGLYSFLGQREELSRQLRAAQEVYFNSSCEISVCIQTHVYRKVR